MFAPKLSESTLPHLISTTAERNSEIVKSKRESAECRAFRKCFAVLVDGVTDPGLLAVQLYSRELIGPDLLKEVQKQAVEERVKTVNLTSY